MSSFLVGSPGYTSPPIICGYNTGQHMWVPASDSCVTLTLDIDTATTTTTRKWNIKVTQYECGNLMAPEESCLQYHTATAGYKTAICLPLNRIDRQNQLVIHQ